MLSRITLRVLFGLLAAGLIAACSKDVTPDESKLPELQVVHNIVDGYDVDGRIDDYAVVTLTTDLSVLSDDERRMLPVLIEAADIMNDLFWRQAFRDHYIEWLDRLPSPEARRLATINYGPWDRLDDNKPFLTGIPPKPKGANYYPADITKDAFEQSDFADKDGLYSLVRRDDSGELVSVPYHVAFADELARAASLLREASTMTPDPDFARYLKLRADAFLDGEYRASDLAWMDSKTSLVDVVIGPIETYEDQLYGYRAAFEAFVLIKDAAWSERLARFSAFLPELQRGLPVPDAYKQEMPGTDSDLNAYDVIYYAGDSNAGSKTIAINLPNDETVQLEKGTRRLQLKNAMRAKFDEILVPITEVLIDPSQRQHITFDAFFANTMFHEVAHGLGIKNTLDGRSTVRSALKDAASSMEEGKADILGLYMIRSLHAAGELGDADLKDNYVTFVASVFRSIRFGASSAHGRANMVRFNYFLEQGAIVRDADSGFYRVDFDRMTQATDALAERLLTLQGDGDYEGASALLAEKGRIGDRLAEDLARLSEAGIPVDIVFRQGVKALGL